MPRQKRIDALGTLHRVIIRIYKKESMNKGEVFLRLNPFKSAKSGDDSID